MKIPIVRNLSSTNIEDVVGFMEISESVAENMAALYAMNHGYKMDACVRNVNGKFELQYVSLSGIPSNSASVDTVQSVASRSNYLTVSQNYNLNVVCRTLSVLFGYGLYQVGSSLERANYRDVDLRCILSNDEYDRMFADDEGKRVKFFNVAISEWIAARTGLLIDFQFQREADANAKFQGRRNAVGCTAP